MEAAVSTIIVATVLVGALNTVAASRTLRGRVADRARAQQLALDLVSEILQLGFADPGTPAASRAAWGYVDDYNGLVDSPPQTKSGTPIPDCANWSRSVTVQWADPKTFAATSATNTGVRLITVTVTRGTLVLASVTALRTSGWVSATPSAAIASGNHPPTASATASPLSGGGGHLTVNYSGTGSSDPDGDTLSYVWSFGDGSSGSGPTLSHNYTAVGTYTATLTVSDGKGGVGVSSVTITVKS
ncbi:MAG TPA: PKD domain-containing protein [Tepidisphaeraceae bacterium]|jgi:PKD repeat protein